MEENRGAQALRIIRGFIWPGRLPDQSFTAGWEKSGGRSLKVCFVVKENS